MSILDAEQSARYIDSLVASVQALEADLAATRDTLRQAAGKCADHECRIDRLDAIRLKWESLVGSTPWRLAGLGYERAYTKFNADRKPENDPADVIRWLLNRADLYDSEKQRAGQAEANFEQAQARIAALEVENSVLRPPAEAYNRTFDRAKKAEARIAALEQRIRDLPNPIGAVTSGANPQKCGGMSPPLWYCTCQWCQARWSFTSWKRDALMTHPENGCLWAEMHLPQADARGREEK